MEPKQSNSKSSCFIENSLTIERFTKCDFDIYTILIIELVLIRIIRMPKYGNITSFSIFLQLISLQKMNVKQMSKLLYDKKKK